ncbi:odorant receptor 131-2-like [Archocentrus centrarchus]|uniref:odorant receptor 131-2-like n=1 Tax=Archocentrus centrarchus TaxID=63155 RepID=UPI0011EA465E|nr:odorant receptor 131-2-like [Archocentrus centrarchus]
MNLTHADSNATITLKYSDTFVTAVSRSVIVVVLGITISYINATMIHTFNKYQIFKLSPRYILFIHMVLNDIIQLATSISLFIFLYAFQTIYVSLCLLIILPAIITTQNTPLNLAFMGAECCVSVCAPLRYNYICTVKRTYIIIGIIWAMSSLSVMPDLFIVLAVEPPQFFLSRVLCYRDTVFRSSYSVNKRDASHILFLVVVLLTLLYSYCRILFVARSADADAKKARNTILIHGFQLLLCTLVYVQPILTKLLVYVLPERISEVNFAFFIINQILPRLGSPMVYGLRDKTFRKYLKKHLCAVNHPAKRSLKVLS